MTARFVAAIAVAGACACSHEQAPGATHPAENAAGAPATTSRIHFTDVTAQSGLDMTLTCGRSPSTQLPEVKGGGLALVDYDNDGDLDVFVPNGAYLDAPDRGPGSRMFENLGNLRFRDATPALGIDFHGWGMGVAIGDVDGDGFDDVYVACYGQDVLLHNDGGKHFGDVTAQAGLGDPRWSTAAAFGDIDDDGDLDLYVVNYIQFDVAHPLPPERFRDQVVFAGPVGKACDADVLYENDGHGRFKDISQTSGILDVKPSAGLGLAILDFDGDGRQDIFVGNDSMPNFLFVNQGDNRFVDMGAKSGISVNGDGAAQATMGIAIGDVNGDGKPDVFTTNFANDTNTLHVSAKDGLYFTDRTGQYGLGQVSRPFVKWATAFFDFDHDGDEDLVLFDGHVYPNATRDTMDSTFLEPPLLFERRAARFARLEAATAGAWLAEMHCDRSAAFADLDGDGDVDIVVDAVNEKVRVLRNDRCEARDGGHWLIVELLDERAHVGNRHALGAKIVLIGKSGVQTRWNFSGGSYQASSAPYVHFGLPVADEVALEISWPGGLRQRLERVVPDQHLIVRRK